MRKSLDFITKHATHSSTIIFLVGFIFDMVMLPDLDDPIARYIGFGHLCVVAFFIMFREWIISRNTASNFEEKLYKSSTFFISLSSGAALSFVFIYALRSAAFAISWPLFVILIACIFANEFVSTHEFRFTLDVGVLLIAVLFYTIFNVPLLLKVQNDAVFGISIVIAMVISLLYIYLLHFTSESARYEASRGYALAIGIPMFVGMLYVLNVIPAVPLSLEEKGVYHSIVRSEGDLFLAQGEVDTRMFKRWYTPVYHVTPTSPNAYFFSAVHAPAELTAPLSHVWERYDASTHTWLPIATIPFMLSGGRENGYRAYSYKENVTAGLWRVSVKVGGRRIVGQVKFYVVTSDTLVETSQVSL